MLLRWCVRQIGAQPIFDPSLLGSFVPVPTITVPQVDVVAGTILSLDFSLSLNALIPTQTVQTA